MDLDFPDIQIAQPFLFDYSDVVVTNAVELFPSVWSAAEDLTSPDINLRRSGLARLNELNAPRVSSLVAYMVATRLDDPDLNLRRHVLQTISALLMPDERGHSAPENVRRHLLSYLAQLRPLTLFNMLEVTAVHPGSEPHLFQILRVCPQAGTYLCDLLADRQIALAVRKQAAHFIGHVGFTDSILTLERLKARFESRLLGQQMMSFAAPSSAAEEADLLPTIESALELLKAP